jgi:hypothetical protein
MATTEIYYFSGTGNSLAVARDLAARLGATLSQATAPAPGRPVRRCSRRQLHRIRLPRL